MQRGVPKEKELWLTNFNIFLDKRFIFFQHFGSQGKGFSEYTIGWNVSVIGLLVKQYFL